MEYRKLGDSGLKVSSLCLGAMTFGEPTEGSFMHGVAADDKTSFEIMDRAFAAGVSFIDVADVYGDDGRSEKIVGEWLARDRRREKMIVATKFRFKMWEGPNGAGASRYRIVRTIEDSLRRLKTDRIDLYQIHMQDLDTPEEETLRALDDLVHAGKVLYLGCSNYAAYRMTDSLWLSRTLGLHHFVTLQAQYSLVVRDLEREHLPAAKKFGLGILPWSPLARGFLSGKYRRGQAPPAGARLEKWKDTYAGIDKERNWRILDAVLALASEHKSTPTAISLAWLLRRPAVSSVIFGARTVAQLEENLQAVSVKLSDADVKRLDEASAWDPGYPYDFIARVQPQW